MENKRKHLEFIQAVITRMGNNSFFIKGWTVTIIAALFVLSAKDANVGFLRLAYYPIIIFWFLDAYYLRNERLYRHLFDKIRALKDDSEIDFNMGVEEFVNEKNVNFLSVLFSKSEYIFYISLTLIVLITKYFLNFN